MKRWKVERYHDTLRIVHEPPRNWEQLRDVTQPVEAMTATVTTVAGIARVWTKLDLGHDIYEE